MAVARLLQPDVLSGVAGGLLAWLAANVWFYYFAAWPLPGFTAGSVMPERLSFVSIDLLVGAGSGFAGYRAGREIALMLGRADRDAGRIPMLAALTLGAAIALLVDFVLIAFTLF
jgi:hypothetical protein